MVNYGFVLLPLYIYPLPGAWDPLFNAAKAYPSVTFQAVINPDNGPGATSCPDSNFIDAMAQLNSIPNIKTLAYVHTANQYNCGSSGSDICSCSRPQSTLENEISWYQDWNVPGKCTSKDVHVGGIFFDEAPHDASCISYMQNVNEFAKDTLTKGNTTLFNAGQAVDNAYYGMADYINVFENSLDVNNLVAELGSALQGVQNLAQSTMIILGSTNANVLPADVHAILSSQQQAMAGLYMPNSWDYTSFPSNFKGFVSKVAPVVSANIATKAASG